MKYLVISYDNDEQQTFYDHVLADDEEKAQEIIASIRGYALPVCAFHVQELYTAAQNLEKASEDSIKKDVYNLIEENGVLADDDEIFGWHKGENGEYWYGDKIEANCPCGNLDCTVCGGNANWKEGDPHVR